MSHPFDKQYQDALWRILSQGVDTDDRTGTGTRKVWDVNFNVDLRTTGSAHLLPALTLRKVFPRTAFEELKWMLRGSTDVRELQELGISIWNGNSSREFLDSRGLEHIREGFIGRGYGYQMRNFNGVDQLTSLLEGIVADPNGRRHLISFWNPKDLAEMALPPCHLLYNFGVTGEYLNLKFYQRSADMVLGVPMNIMFSAFFLTIVAQATGFKVGNLAHSIGDAHIYQNHIEVAEELCATKSIVPGASFTLDVPEYNIDLGVDALIQGLRWEDVKLSYDSHPALDRNRLTMAV